MDKKQLEIRNLGHLEVRANENSRKIEGCAIVFNQPSVDMGFREVLILLQSQEELSQSRSWNLCLMSSLVMAKSMILRSM